MIGHQARRVVQTPKAFSNWPELLRQMTQERFGRGPAELTFTSRTGQRITCPNRPGARVPIYEVYAEDTYDLRSFLGPLVDQPLRVIDIGAHVGAFACSFAALSPQALIECFEPSTHSAVYLRRNVDQNGLGDRVTVSECAVASTVGTAVFLDNEGGSALNALAAAAPGGPVTTATSTEVKTTTFDAVVASRPEPVEFVKLDCEGGEYDAVLSSSPASWSSVKRVVLEYHPSDSFGLDDLVAWFADCGLRLTRRETVARTREPFGSAGCLKPGTKDAEISYVTYPGFPIVPSGRAG